MKPRGQNAVNLDAKNLKYNYLQLVDEQVEESRPHISI